MKKAFAAAAAITLLCAAAFCKENPSAPLDEYDDGSQAEVSQSEKKSGKKDSAKKETKIKWNTKANKEAAMEGDPYNKKKMRGNRNFGERLLNINKFTKMDPISAYLKPTLGPMFLRKGHLIYREGTDIAGFMMYYDSSAYALQFSKAARAVVCAAIDSYYKDFDEKRLDRNAKASKTRGVYGFCEGFEDFGVVSGMMTNFSRPLVYCGYIFEKNTPYFTLNVRRAKNLAVNEKSEEGALKANTIEQTYYLTKAQAKKLSVFLSEANISALQAASTLGDEYEESDVYQEAGEAPATPAAQEAPAAQDAVPPAESAEKESLPKDEAPATMEEPAPQEAPAQE